MFNYVQRLRWTAGVCLPLENVDVFEAELDLAVAIETRLPIKHAVPHKLDSRGSCYGSVHGPAQYHRRTWLLPIVRIFVNGDTAKLQKVVTP